ncbi:MAG: hypothetical protein ACRDPF_14910 [Streptosporangiaceae bacterium]
MAESYIVKQDAPGPAGRTCHERRSTDTSEAPARERRRLGRFLPVLADAAIAAIGQRHVPGGGRGDRPVA